MKAIDADNYKHMWVDTFDSCYGDACAKLFKDSVDKAPAIETPNLDKIRTEIGKSKTRHEMQLSENDLKGKLLISDIYCDIVGILDKYKLGSEVQEDE